MLKLDSLQSDHNLQAASDKFEVLTYNGVISSAIASAAIAGIGLVFFALFIWKRKTLDPPSYIDIEKARKLDEKERGENSPELPIQFADGASSGPKGSNPFSGFAPYDHYRESLAGRTRGYPRSGSNASSITANDSAYDLYKGTLEQRALEKRALEKRALSTNSVSSTDSTCRDSVSDYGSDNPGSTNPKSRGQSVGSISSLYSDESRYSQMSERIVINNVRMPPQFATPTRPPSIVSQRQRY